ncbi:glycerol kinase GlpK [Croceicoccus naphthovorans]|uniref:Glycerol kinase n=1 Tax=Croceicoccus naphthovorans TaxID=1348774 RepID=A0A0G3XGP4_9SPHN|nr:glycerol kinase GlpK [Croceicoccus naphthovorans]AKM10700.1 glycerol kinase [Croceicoccus naphthovorans]MBB3992189.1 glycerol kinase [Croceicoccus naphthovorans]
MTGSGPFILAIDQGTTSTRTIVFDQALNRVAVSQQEFAQHYPQPGWVEHDADEIWNKTLATARAALQEAGAKGNGSAKAIGITNQRETVVIWDRATGTPIHKAIVWQDRRTADTCEKLRAAGHEDTVRDTTGLLLDPYFSATKIAWMLDAVPNARERAERGELAFGTIDCFLLWRLTGGKVHATDATNASRTLLLDIETGDWSDTLCDLFRVPRALLPRIGDSAEVYGTTDPDLLGEAIPIAGMAGDQQAALVGQACFKPGMVKSTYGTGCFAVMNTGDTPLRSTHRLLTTVGYRIGGKTTYALEGSIFVAGAAVKWLRDAMALVENAAETAELAATLDDNGGVYLVPAFAGLGAPHWDPHARAALLGMTLGTTRAHVARATLEAVVYQTMDLIEAMIADGAPEPDAIRVDGGMAANDWFCAFLADMLDTRIDRPEELETTALGAAALAGLGIGLYADLAAIEAMSALDQSFTPTMAADDRAKLAKGWKAALGRVTGN